MAEVLTAVEVALAITDVVKLLHSYIAGVASARAEIRRLTHELFALQGALEHLDLLEDAVAAKDVAGMLAMTHETLSALAGRLAKSTGLAGKLAWPFKAAEVDKHLAALERAKTWFVLVLVREGTAELEKVYDEVKKLRDVVQEEAVERARGKMVREMEELLAWLAPVSAEGMVQKARAGRMEGTGMWFVRGLDFEEWLGETKRPVLWVTGKSGSGKTVLFSTIIDDLQSRVSPTVSLGYHCCTLSDTASQPLPNILGSILAQLCAANPSLTQYIAPHKRPSTPALVPTNSLTKPDILDILDKVLLECERLYVCVDALNETGCEEELVQLLREVCGRSAKVRVLVTCTREPLVRTPEIREHRMEVDLVDRDIEAYVQHRLSTEPSFTALSDKIKAEVQHKIVASADGMFRWALLCLDRLAALRTGRDVRDALLDMPTTLSATYIGILSLVRPHDRAMAREALLWLCFALRPLTLHELAEAVVFRESDEEMDDDCRLTNPVALLDVCRHLVVRTGEFVMLAHDSIRSFLTSVQIRASGAAFFALDATSAHANILRKSLAYLSLTAFSSGPVTARSEYRARLRAHPLARYAAVSWPTHSEHASPLSADDEGCILAFFAAKAQHPRGGRFDAWVQLLLETTDLGPVRNTQPLYYAASFNMLAVLRLLLRPGSDVDLNRGGGRFHSPPLFVAVWRRNYEAARLLVEAGANPDVEDTSGMTARELAERRGVGDLILAMDEADMKKRGAETRRVLSGQALEQVSFRYDAK